MTALNPQGGDPRLLSPLALAFVGDGVYELLVREHLLAQGNAPVGRLHSRTVELVSANAQSAAYERIATLLTPEEEAIYRRGRNANSTRCPKHTNPINRKEKMAAPCRRRCYEGKGKGFCDGCAV